MDAFENVLAFASKQPVGIAVLCHGAKEADKLKRKLYALRAAAREAGNKDYDELTLSFSPHSGDILYVYKRAPKDE